MSDLSENAKNAVITWLLDSDSSIRWQVLQDLMDSPEREVNEERAKVASEGWGKTLLTQQKLDGSWNGVAWNRGWDSTMHVLMLLRDMGLHPESEEAIRAVELVRDNVTWQGWEAYDGNPFFVGEVEPCINGQVGAVGAYFRQNIQSLIERLLSEQLADGGWNCEAENGSTRSSFHTTICVLEALLEYELNTDNHPEVTTARLRGQEYLLERKLFKRKSTGEVILIDRKDSSGANDKHPAFTQFAFPAWWHYDVLRGLEYFRQANIGYDKRLQDAIELVLSKRDDSGRWSLEIQYSGQMPIKIDEGVGQPSRWNTLRAMRVLKWYAQLENE